MIVQLLSDAVANRLYVNSRQFHRRIAVPPPAKERPKPAPRDEEGAKNKSE
jgi:hypothetical protein